MVDSFKAFIDKWHTPTVYTILIGGIIWGVQLNFAVLELTKQMAIQHEETDAIRDEVQNLTVLLAKTAAELGAVARVNDALERRMTRNETWISQNRNHKHGQTP